MVIDERVSSDSYELTSSHGERELRRELARVIAGQPPGRSVRSEIADSWQHSVSFGLRPQRFELPFEGANDEDSRLAWAAMPVFDSLVSDLASTKISVVLAGKRCRVVTRSTEGPLQDAQLGELLLSPGYVWGIEHAGTNGLSSAFSNRSPFVVHGDEHFADALTRMTTAGAPIRDPHTGQVVGVLGLVCSAEEANSLLLPIVSRAIREVERRLLNGLSGTERLIQEKFLDARRRTRGPLVAVTRAMLLTNAAAARLLSVADRSRLWDFVSGTVSVAEDKRVAKDKNPRFELADGRAVSASLEAILDGPEVAGALVRFAICAHEAPSPRRAHSSKPLRPSFGWESLTEAEYSVTELVADGLTNREVAVGLFLSPHTVDSHLRHIFRKLDINSRVDLVRMVTARNAVDRSLVGATHVA
jgi:DNA-binding CsgD family transcriptional regulator